MGSRHFWMGVNATVLFGLGCLMFQLEKSWLGAVDICCAMGLLGINIGESWQ